MKTKVISAFPGVGKTSFYEYMKDHVKISDSDSSLFDKNEFPQNYIAHIQSLIDEDYDYVLVSSHKEVRDALNQAGIYYTLVYPQKELKSDYIQRYVNRGDTQEFINLMDTNWDTWNTEMNQQLMCSRVCIGKNQFLSNLVHMIN